VIGGVERKIHFFAMDLPHSDAGFVQAYPAETTEAFCAGHVAAFAFFGKVPASILYDNTKLAVARILGDGRRRDRRKFGGQAAIATCGCVSLAGWNLCPKPEPSVPL
jgi:transposase